MLFKTVVVPTDFSPASIRALQQAVELAARDQGRIVLVHVGVPPVDAIHGLEPGSPAAPLFTEAARELGQMLDRRLADLASAHIPDAMARKTIRLDGYPPDEIARIAVDEKADLIVMGTHGRTGIDRVLFGSVAARCIQKAPVPVLVTR